VDTHDEVPLLSTYAGLTEYYSAYGKNKKPPITTEKNYISETGDSQKNIGFWRQADSEKNSVLDTVTTLATSHTDTQTRKQYQDHTASEAVAFNHTNEFTVVVVVVVAGLFHLIEDVLHVGKVEVGACRSAEDVKNVAACRLKVACCIVAS